MIIPDNKFMIKNRIKMQMFLVSLLFSCISTTAMEQNPHKRTLENESNENLVKKIKKIWLDLNTGEEFEYEEKNHAQETDQEVEIIGTLVNEKHKQAHDDVWQGYNFLYGARVPQNTEAALKLLLKTTQQKDNMFAQAFAMLLINDVSFQKARTRTDKQARDTLLKDILKINQQVLEVSKKLPEWLVARAQLQACQICQEAGNHEEMLKYAHQVANQDTDDSAKKRAKKLIAKTKIITKANKKHVCFYRKCRKKFTSSEELKEHRDKYHIVRCPICNDWFSEKYYKLHLTKKHNYELDLNKKHSLKIYQTVYETSNDGKLIETVKRI